MPTQLEPFTGAETFDAPPDRVFRALTDPEELAPAIPGLVSWERADEATLLATVRPQFAFLRTTLRLTLNLTESARPEHVLMHIDAKGIGVSMRIACEMTITHGAGGHGSRVDWRAGVEQLHGLITAVSPTLIRAAADQVICEGWRAIRNRVEAPGRTH